MDCDAARLRRSTSRPTPPVDGLDPRSGSGAWRWPSPTARTDRGVRPAHEALLLDRLDEHLAASRPASSPPGTARGSTSPSSPPAPAAIGVELGLRLWPDPASAGRPRAARPATPPPTGPRGTATPTSTPTASTGPTSARRWRSRCSLKSDRPAGRASTPVEVDASRIHDLTPTQLAAYVGSDARCTRAAGRCAGGPPPSPSIDSRCRRAAGSSAPVERGAVG